MKQFLKYIPLIMTIFLSCDKENDAIGEECCPIKFGIEKISSTKAISETTSAVMDADADGFTVSALNASNGLLFFKDEAVWTEGGEYKTKQEHFYPSGVNAPRMDFYARYPHGNITVSGSSVNIEGYTTDGTADLVVATAKNITSSGNPVMLSFEHILSGFSVFCKGTDEKMNYKVLTSEVTFSTGGTYSYNDGQWSSTAAEPLSVSEKAVSTSEWVSIVSERSIIPGDVTLSLSWECTDKESGIVTGRYANVTKVTQVSKGHISRIECKLGNVSATDIAFTVTIIPWEDKDNNVEFE